MQVRKNFLNTITTVPYGTVYKTAQDVADFIFGYDAAVKYSLSIAVGIAAPISALLLWLGLTPYRKVIEEI